MGRFLHHTRAGEADHARHRKWGRLFGDRYKAVVGEDRYHYQTLMDYIHLNPVRARIIRPKAGQSVLDYPWSSVACGYALPSTKRAKWLDTAAGMKAFNLSDTAAGRRAVSEEIKSCGVPPQSEEADSRASHLRRGWYWGTRAFGEAMRKLGQRLLKKTAPVSRAYQKHELVRERGERQALAWLARGLKAGGMKKSALFKVKGSDPRKVLLADLLWRRTGSLRSGWRRSWR